MTPRRVALVPLLTLVTLAAAGSAAAQGSGTRFTLMFLQNIVDMPQNRPVELHVINQGTNAAHVNVTLPLYVSDSCQSLYQATVLPGSSARIVLCPDIRHSHYDGGLANKAVIVTSDVTVSVVGYNSDMYSADAFAVLPEQSLRAQYLTTAYAPTNIATQFGIVALRDTSIALYLPKVGPGGKETFFDYNGVVYRNGDFVRFLLPSYHTFLAYSISDLSGIIVWASDSVAVFSGNARTYVDYSRGSRDHIVEQAVPSSQFGKSFAFYPIPRQHPGDVVRIVARSHTTDVTVYGSSSATPSTFRLNTPGEFYEGSFSEVSHIIASKTVSVSVIVRSQEGAAVASSDPNDPSIYFLPAVEHFSAEPRRTPTFVYSVNEGSFSKSYILISVTEGLQSGIRVDGLPVSGWLKPAASPLLVVSTAVPVDPSTSHTVSHTDATTAFSVVLYSASDRESAATWLGLNYSASCFDSPQVTLGDGLDNDCDGLVDEENCTNLIDDDNDGLINEDCFRTDTPVLQLGNKYEVIFLSNDVFDAEIKKVSELELYVFSSERKDMQITVKSPKYLDENNYPVVNYTQFVHANQSWKFQIPIDLRLGDESDFGLSTLTHKGIRVESKDGELFFLYGINKRSYSTDSFLVYPLEASDNGQEYKYYYTISSDRYGNDYDRSIIGIVAHEDDTDVWVDLRSGVMVTMDDTLVEGPTTLHMKLMAHDSWELQSLQDLSGSKVYTKGFISVYSGNVRTKIPVTAKSRDHLVEQIPVTDFLGTNYSSISTPRDDNAGDLWKVVATESDTYVDYVYTDLINPGPPVYGQTVLTSAGDFFLIDPGYHVTIYIAAEDGKKILVGQFVKSTTSPETLKTDPALIFLPSPDQWTNSYWFTTPLSGKLDSDGITQLPFDNWMLIVTTNAFKDSIQVVDKNGHPIVGGGLGAVINWHDVPGGNDQVAARVAIIAGQTTAFAKGPFMLIIFGVQDRESYGSVAGMVFQRNSQVCKSIAMNINDGIDNDCDGSTDEELFDNLDNDGDGRIDEDCYATPVLSHRYDLVYEENTVEYPKLYALELVIGAPSGVNIFCRVSNPSRASPHYDSTVIVPGGNVRRFEFSPSLRIAGAGVKWPNSFRVECSDRATVFALNKDTYSADGFVAFSAESLGSRYYVMSYAPEALLAQYAAVATEPGQTTLTITPPAGGGPAFTVHLLEGDVYQGQGDSLTGTLITADKKFALFSGDVRTSVKISNSRDHLVSQIPSVDKWGTEFNLVPTAGRIVPDVYQILADDSATVTVCCGSSTNVYNLAAGAVQQLTLQSFCHLSSSRPVLVARISQSHTAYPTFEAGDPSMIIAVPESLYGSGDTLATPVSTGGYNTLSADYSHYLTVIVPTTAKDGVQIAGVDLTASGSIVWNTIGCSSYSAGVLSVPGNHHVFQLSHVSPTVRLTAVLDGSADRESYSVTLSQAL